MNSDRRGIYCAVAAGIAFLLLSMVAEVSGKSYYIDAQNGSDKNSGTSPSLAWQTLAFASGETLGPGDSLLLKRGCQWMEGFECNAKGSPGKPFYLGAYGSGSAPVINDSTDANGYGIELLESWVVVESLLVKNGFNGGIFITQYADSSIVRNCEVTASGTGIEVQGRYDLIRGNYLHDLTMILNEQGNEGDYGAVGVTVEGSCNEICYNRMIRCSASCYEGGADGGVVELYGTTDSCLIHHNLGVACNGFVEVGGGSAINTRLYYNVLINCGVGICIHLNDGFASVVQNLRMENNTILDTTSGSTPIYDLIDFIGTPTASTFLFRNNIVLAKNFSNIVQTTNASSGWAFTHTHNRYFLESSATKLNITLDSGETQGNPLFVNYADTDLCLASNSPVVSSGQSLGYTLDFYNNSVPTNPSLGAIQYSASTGASALSTPLAAPIPAAPVNGATGQASSLRLSWTSVSGATSYTVLLSTSSTFANTVLTQTGTGLTDSVGCLLYGGISYYWQAGAASASGTAWSGVWSFVTATPPASPTLLSPTGGKQCANGQPLTVTWSAVASANSYTVQVAPDSTFSSTTLSQTSLTTSSTFTPEHAGSNYWRVSATDAAGTGKWSATGVFTDAATTAVLSTSLPAKPSFGMKDGMLSYTLDKEYPVEIRIFDLLGRKLFELNRIQQSGSYSFSLSNLNLSSELHIISFKAGNVEQRISVPGRISGR